MEAVNNLPVKCQQVLVAICFNEKKYHFVLSVFSMVVVLYMTVRK